MDRPGCRDARARFSDLLDGESQPPLTWFMTALHAQVCPFCRPVYRSLRATQDALRALRDEVDAPAGADVPAGPRDR